MTTRSIVTALVVALMLGWGAAASAQQTKCLAGKTKCMATKAAGLLKCEETAETPGKVADPACVTKVEGKFDGGADPSKGCFMKLASKPANNCSAGDDTAAAETAVDNCVASLVGAIDPPPTMQTKCGVGKKKCVAKYLISLLKCQSTAQTPGKDPNPNAGGCVDKATAKYTGGADTTKGCFAKLQAKNPNDCRFTNDSGTVQGVADTCVTDLVAVVANTTSTTTTTTTSTTTTTCPAPTPGTVKGSLTATPGRFNYVSKVGLPAANEACSTTVFACTHACTYPELQTAAAAGELVGLKDTANNPVMSFWAIDSTQPALEQCQDDVVSFLNWEYATAHTMSRGQKVDLNSMGQLVNFQSDLQCNFSTSWVACCKSPLVP